MTTFVEQYFNNNRENAAVSQDGGVVNRNLLLTHILVRLAWGTLQKFSTTENAKFSFFSITHYDTTYIQKKEQNQGGLAALT